MPHETFGLLDNRFLSQSIGLLDPRPPLTLNEERSVGEAIEVLRAHKVGCVVITDARGALRGIFTERDVLLKLDLSSVNEEQRISEVMTPNPVTAEMTAPIAFILQLMSEGGFRHVPIVDEERYAVGIVSVKDIVDYIVGRLTKDLHAFGESK